MADFREKKGNTGGADKGPQGGHQAQSGQQAGETMSRHSGSGVLDQVREGAQSAMNTVGEFAGQATERVQDWMSGGGDLARQTGQRLQHAAGDAYGFTSEHLRDFGGELTGMVRRYPIAAVLIGLGVGMLIGRSTRT